MRIRGENAGVSNGVVAIVDYDSAVRDSLIFLLETAGYRVEAYDSALRFLAEPDLSGLACIILDHEMSFRTGLAVVGRLRSRGTVVPVLLFTASPTPEVVQRANELNGIYVLEKPAIDSDILAFVAAPAA